MKHTSYSTKCMDGFENKYMMYIWQAPFVTLGAMLAISSFYKKVIFIIFSNTYVSISWGISSKSSKVLWFASSVWFIFLFSKICSADSINSVQPEVSFGISVICKWQKGKKKKIKSQRILYFIIFFNHGNCKVNQTIYGDFIHRLDLQLVTVYKYSIFLSFIYSSYSLNQSHKCTYISKQQFKLPEIRDAYQ